MNLLSILVLFLFSSNFLRMNL
ncbi:hypothetical protein D1609_03645 [Leptospira borgpetersenii serovar Hardjo-bovis]|nr:hypothetical protein D1609_03645 [Leptospira borgpetersenii serovar Hardjo-bovis]TQE52798.1 hypothetical protein FFZ95_09535 [Leptospira borgpetersenii]TQE54730.1 hypothetical protein FFZ96_13610 [Leptospira borgpetersenii]